VTNRRKKSKPKRRTKSIAPRVKRLNLAAEARRIDGSVVTAVVQQRQPEPTEAAQLAAIEVAKREFVGRSYSPTYKASLAARAILAQLNGEHEQESEARQRGHFRGFKTDATKTRIIDAALLLDAGISARQIGKRFYPGSIENAERAVALFLKRNKKEIERTRAWIKEQIPDTKADS